MANVDFTTWTETDPDSDFTVTTNQISVASLNAAWSTQDLVYLDQGASYYTGDFHFRYGPITLTSPGEGANMTLLAVCNFLPDETNIKKDSTVVYYQENTGTDDTLGLAFFNSSNVTNTPDSSDSYTGTAVNPSTAFYIDLERVSGVVNCKLYSDAYSTLVATLSMTPASTPAYRYVIAAAKYQTGSGATVGGTLQNLDITVTGGGSFVARQLMLGVG